MKHNLITLIVLVTTFAFGKDVTKTILKYCPIYENGAVTKYICITNASNSYDNVLEITNPDLETQKAVVIPTDKTDKVSDLNISKDVIYIKVTNSESVGKIKVYFFTFKMSDLSMLGKLDTKEGHWGISQKLDMVADGFMTDQSFKEKKQSKVKLIKYNNNLQQIWEKVYDFGFLKDDIDVISYNYPNGNTKYLMVELRIKTKIGPNRVAGGYVVLDNQTGNIVSSFNYLNNPKDDFHYPMSFDLMLDGNFLLMGVKDSYFNGYDRQDVFRVLVQNSKTGAVVTDKSIPLNSDEFKSKLNAEVINDIITNQKNSRISVSNVMKVNNEYVVYGRLYNHKDFYIVTKEFFETKREYIYIMKMTEDFKITSITTYKTVCNRKEGTNSGTRYYSDYKNNSMFTITYQNFPDDKTVEFNVIKFDGTKAMVTKMPFKDLKFTSIQVFEASKGKFNIVTCYQTPSSITYELIQK